MRITKIRPTDEVAVPVIHPRTNTEIREDTRGLVHWFRVRLYGQCPFCKSTHGKQITGWNKKQCENCGETWIY